MSEIFRDSIFWVEVERIKPNPFQPRREFDQAKLQELSESIRMYGLLQPLTVTKKETPREDGGISVEYELIAGERRLRASKLAGIQQLPVIIRSGENSDQEKLELAIIENLQREDLNPVDRARAFYDLHKKFGFTHTDIGKKMGKSREYVTNTLRLLSLPEVILSYIAEGRITEGHTRPLMMLNSRPEEQMVLAKEILLKKLTVRETEAIARRAAQERVREHNRIDPDILSVERALTEKLGTRVTIEPREVGGRLVISFFSAQDLQALLDSMRVDDERVVVSEVFNGTEVASAIAAVEGAVNAPSAIDGGVEEEMGTLDTDEPFDGNSAENSDTFAIEEEKEPLLSEDSDGTEPKTMVDGVEKTSAGVFDSILSAIGRAPEEKAVAEEESTPSEVETKVEPVLEPSAERPLPELESVPPVFEEKKEDDAELYSIRNFSI